MKHSSGVYSISKAFRFSAICLALLVFCAIMPVFSAAEDTRPTVLVFEVNADENVSSTHIATATKAIRDYFRQTGKVEAVVFDKKSPLVTRAVMERKISPDKVISYEDKNSRAEVAKALGINYACGAHLGIEQLKVRMSMWLLDAEKPKKKWELVDYISESGRMDEMGMRNAIHSVCSGMVNEIVQSAFADVAAIAPQADQENAPEPALQKPVDPAANAVDLGNSAEINLKQGNTARAVDLYQKAINANPSDHSIRIKLAEVYHKRGMDQEANDELDRAIAVGADKAVIEAARARIFGNGDTASENSNQDSVKEPVANTSSSNTSESSANKPTNAQAGNRTQTNTAANAAVDTASESAGLVQGDKLWNAGDAEGAERAYLQAIANNPKDWRVYERLAILQAAQYRFLDSRNVLAELNTVQPAPPEDVLRLRYRWLSQVLDYGVNALLADMETSIENFESHRITRESCYESIKSSKSQLQALILYADDLVYPPEMRQANANRVQSCRLGMQAAGGLMEYLETNLVKFKNNALVFVEQAKIELIEIKDPSATADK